MGGCQSPPLVARGAGTEEGLFLGGVGKMFTRLLQFGAAHRLRSKTVSTKIASFLMPCPTA
jgi:hypothetical protein